MATQGKNIFILIPAYNEEKAIGQVLQSLRKNGYYNIFLVNDGSADNTHEVAYENGAEVLNHIMNRGQGAALRTGIEYLRENHDPDIIITFDADGQHRPEDIPRLIAPILSEEADVVLGSRFLEENQHVPKSKKVVLKAGVFFTNITSHVKLTDTHNGLRAFNKKAINSIRLTRRGMEHASEIIDEIKDKQLNYMEVPVRIVYSEYSKFKGQKTSNFIKLGIKIIIRKFFL